MFFWTATITGFMVTFVGAGETFMAVLYPRATNGPITATINRAFHEVLTIRRLATSRCVVAAGPALIVTQVLCWATLLLVGISLIVWPQLGTGITATGSQPTDTDFASAVYYAGFTITTLGVGDLVPRRPMVLAYVISVYSTLARRNQFANEIEYRTGRTGESTPYLKAYLTDSDPSLINQDLFMLSSNMAQLLESHHFYPVLHYFRFTEPRYRMSRMLGFCLEVASVMRAARQAGSSTPSAGTEAVDRLWHASMQMLEETKLHFVSCESTSVNPDSQLATELAPLMDQSHGSKNRFEAAFVELQSEWLHDLKTLAIGTGCSSRPTKTRSATLRT